MNFPNSPAVDQVYTVSGRSWKWNGTVWQAVATDITSPSDTAAEVLAKLITVDGAGSGLDADLLDGQQGTYYRDLANATGTLLAAQAPAHTGDVTSSAGSLALTIAANAVSLGKMATVATATILGRTTAGSGDVEAMTVSQVRSMLSLNLVENTALSTWGGSANITTVGTIGSGTWNGTVIADAKIATALTGKTYNGLILTSLTVGFTIAGGTTSKTLTVPLDATVSGINTGDQTITLTGDVTGSGVGSFAATIANNAVSLAKMATMATASFLGRNTAGTGNVEVLSVATAKTLLGLTGTNSGDQTISLTGDVTGSGTGSFAATIANNSVTLAKMATMATASFLGRNTAAVGNVEVLSVATAKTLLNLTGTNSGDQTIALTGDVTGTGTGSFAATIANNAVTLAKMATMATASFLGRNTAAVGNVEVLSAATAKTMLALVKADVGLGSVENTALSTWAGTSNITTVGTVATGVWNATAIADGKIASALTGKTYNGLTLTAVAVGFTIAGGTTSKTLTVSDNATVSGTNTGDQTITLTGDVTGTGTGSFAATIANNAVTLAKMATMATASFLGRNTAGTGNVEVLSVATAKTLLALVKADVGLGNVENTALSTWAGSANITTLGTIATGVWNATVIADGKIASALTGKTYNGLTLTAVAVGFTIAGGTTSKTLTVADNASVSGTNTGDQTITLTGDVTGSGTGSFAATIANNAVTLAKMATMATASFLGRNTAGTGNVEVLSVATAKTLLALVKADVGLGNVDNTSDATKFTNTALTGVPTAPTASGGTNTTQVATTAFVTAAVAAGGGGGGMTWTTISSANVATAVTKTGYIMETGGTQRDVTLPASVAAGFYISVNASGGSVRIVSNGNIIDQVGSGNNLVIPDGGTVSLVAKSTGNLEIVYGKASVDLSTADAIGTLPVTKGGTGLAAFTTNNLVYASGTTTLASLATANNGVLVTSAGGVPSISSALPAGLTMGGRPILTPAPSVQSITSASTFTPAMDTEQEGAITALAATCAIQNPTGTLANGQKYLLHIKDNGGAQTLSWGSTYAAGVLAALPTTTVAGKAMVLGFRYNSATSKLELIAYGPFA